MSIFIYFILISKNFYNLSKIPNNYIILNRISLLIRNANKFEFDVQEIDRIDIN